MGVALDSGGKPFELPYRRGQFVVFSPDGRWVAYLSRETGEWETYVAPFPGPGRSWQISNGGGFMPRWRADGKEILYLSGGGPYYGKLMAAEVTLGKDRVDVGAVRFLFDLPWVGPRIMHDITPDAERILALAQQPATASAPLTLIVNWPALLKK